MTDIIKLREDWQRAKAAAAKAAQAELEARTALVRATFDTLEEGTQTYMCEDGIAVKVTLPYAYKILIDNQEEIETILDRIPEHIKASLIKYKPQLAVGEYRKLSPIHKKLIDSILEIKPGTFQVKL